MPVFIDLPETSIDAIDATIAGWAAGAREDVPLRVMMDGKSVPHFLAERPDVRAAYPQLGFSTGFGAAIDILDLTRPDFAVSVEYGDEKAVRHISLTRRALSEQARERVLREAARAWCMKHILCPQCRDPSATAREVGTRIVCSLCGAAFRQYADKIDFLPDDMRFALTPEPETTSANPYDPAALDLINSVVQKNGMVLDCGAGFRKARMRNVINVEIAAYRSTDVLAVGERLPFKDASFDAVLSLAVLEHVRHPFACAQEMLRVIKPGGKIMCSVPFLQPEHNFPGHFYNMTQSGLENLFAGKAELLSAEVPPHGHPIFAVQWILRDYLAGLPAPARENFARMTIGEAATADPASRLGDDFASQLSAAAQRRIGCLNTLVFRRPESAAA